MYKTYTQIIYIYIYIYYRICCCCFYCCKLIKIELIQPFRFLLIFNLKNIDVIVVVGAVVVVVVAVLIAVKNLRHISRKVLFDNYLLLLKAKI